MTHSSPAHEPGQVERLLGESAWVRRVALAIAGDETLADDLTQDAWLAALRRIRTGESLPRNWFAGALRNLALMRRRGDARREEREHSVVGPQEHDDGATAIERLEQQQLVLQAVHELEEPYRTTVVWRWLDGLEPAEIAERSGVPVRTVHTRITRALQHLRERLGRHPDVAASGWARARSVFMGRWIPSWPVVLTMNIKWKVALVVSATGLLVGLWYLLRAANAPTPAGGGRIDADLVSTTVSPAPSGSANEGTSGDTGAREAVLAVPETEPAAAAPMPLVRGRIVDATRAPVAGATVYLRPAGESPPLAGRRLGAPLASAEVDGDWRNAARTESDGEGRFAFREAAVGHLQLAVRAPGHAPFEQRALGVPDGGRDLGDIALGKGTQLVGRVVDARGVGIGGVRLLARGEDDSTKRENPPTWLPAGRTNPEGHFSIDGLSPGPWELRAESDEHPLAVASGECDVGACTGIEIRLEDSCSISGRVEGADEIGEPLVVRARFQRPKGTPNSARGPKSEEAPVASDGTFAVRGLVGSDSRWKLGVWRANDMSGNPTPITRLVEAGSNDTDIVLAIPAPTRLVLRPVDVQTHAAVVDARCEVGLNSGYLGILNPTEQADGTRLLELRLPDDAPWLSLTLTAPGYERARLKVDALPIGETLDLGSIELKATPVARVRVLDGETRQPIVGARVRIENVSVPMGMLGGTDAPSRKPTTAPERSSAATTDSAGEAVLNLALGSEAVIVALVDGYATETTRVDAPSAAGVHAVDLELGRGASLEVLVRSGTEPLAGALVRQIRRRGEGESDALDLATPEVVAATDREGIARFHHLRPGRYRLGVQRGSASWHTRGSAELDVVDGTQRFELLLPPATELHGRLRRSGQPLVGATVRGVVSMQQQGDGGGNFVTSAGYAKTDDAGRFRLADLDPGPCELLVEHPCLSLPARWTPALVPGRNELEYVVGESALRGRAVDVSGDPIPDLVLTLSVPSGKPGFLGNAPPVVLRSKTDASGAFAFEDLPQGVALSLAPEGGDYLPHAEPVVLATNEVREDWLVRLERAGVLHVVLDVPEGKQVGGNLVAEMGAEKRSVFVLQTSEGTLRGLPPGTWSVHVRPVLDFRNEVLAGPVDVVIEGGKTTEVRLQIP